ncbi:MAG TPA: hypothetical protein VFW22_16420 [Pseudolabrys sp.]|nr:hypothetical protein [Pseudolabrys sp.]
MRRYPSELARQKAMRIAIQVSAAQRNPPALYVMPVGKKLEALEARVKKLETRDGTGTG